MSGQFPNSAGGHCPITATRHASHAVAVRVGSQDLTGATYDAVVLNQDGSLALTLTVTATDPPNGLVTISWTRAQIGALKQGTYRWRYSFTLAGFTRQVLQGPFTITDQ